MNFLLDAPYALLLLCGKFTFIVPDEKTTKKWIQSFRSFVQEFLMIFSFFTDSTINITFLYLTQP